MIAKSIITGPKYCPFKGYYVQKELKGHVEWHRVKCFILWEQPQLICAQGEQRGE